MTDSGSDNLRARILQLTSSDSAARELGSVFGQELERRVAEATAPLEAKIAAVEKLHQRVGYVEVDPDSGERSETSVGCMACITEAYPCATVRALASGQERGKDDV